MPYTRLNNINKDYSIELLKAFAVILITNSHMNQMYGNWNMLATGGAIGDVLFFFCSGYTLFLGKDLDFTNWYKRRINRIIPTVFVWALLHLSFSMDQIGYSMPIDLGAGWFIPCILLYYIILYPIKKYLKNKIWMVFCISIAVVVLWYILVGIEAPDHNMYGATYFKWVHYFPYMLLGSIIGKKRKNTLANEERKEYKLWTTICILVISIILFYVFCAFKLYPKFEYLQLFSIVPLLAVVIYFWRLCNTNLALFLINRRYVGSGLLLIGSLCLEIYICQSDILTTTLNPLFPFNIPILFLCVFIGGYILRCCTRFCSQTFNKEPYNWKEMIKIL